MSDSEWEALCDGCGRCCLQKLQCADTEEVFYTQLSCELLDLDTCRCSDYQNRTQEVENCVNLRKLEDHEWGFMPSTCAYRLIKEGKPLEDWHPLIAGNHEKMDELGMRVGDKVISETIVLEEDFEDHIVTWVHC